MNISQMKIERRAKMKEARVLSDKITENIPEREARKIEAEFNNLMLEIDDLRDRIEDAEERTANDRPDPRRPDERGLAKGVDGPEEDAEHREAFSAFLRNPGSPTARAKLGEAEQRAGTTLTGAAGGYVVPSLISTDIFDRIRDLNTLRQIVRVERVASGDITFPLNNNDATGGWAGETDDRTATTEPTLAAKKPTFGTLYANVKLTEELNQDAIINVPEWFARSAAEALSALEMTAMLTGNGTSKPTGMLNTAPEAGDDGSRTANAYKYLETTGASAVTSDELLDTIYDLKSGYRAKGRWIMNSATAGAVRKLKDGDGRYMWTDSLSMGQPATLIGYPVTIVEDMDDIGAGNLPIGFGDWSRAYILADRSEMFVTVDDNITSPGWVKLYIRQRIGGCVYDENAARFIKNAAS